MCGIFGYIGTKDPLPICLHGLKQLEYRGYDSSGVAGIQSGRIVFCKEVGKIASLEKKIQSKQLKLELAIGHTRWATHGKPSGENAHPHFDDRSTIALVHNGIIENYSELKQELIAKGIRFSSDTDTEVIVQLIAHLYQGNLVQAVQRALPHLRGAFAIALVHQNHPDSIVAAARESPLCIGYDDVHSEAVVSSDPNALIENVNNVVFLHNDEIAEVKAGKVSLFGLDLHLLQKKPERMSSEFRILSKAGFEHFMLKEIFEQPSTIQKAFFGRIDEENLEIKFEHLRFSPDELKRLRNIWLLGCGTSSHAGWLATLFFEEIARIPATVDIASEARYRNPLLTPDTLVISISQSGETADTLAAMRMTQQRGCKALALCNVKNSAMSREAFSTLFLNAGAEVSVCSTKAFTSQMTVLFLFALHLARLKGLPSSEMLAYLQELKKIPGHVQQVLDRAGQMQAIAKKYAHYNNCFFIGRRYMVPTALEAALKLKEISYINANGTPSGELKHGHIALINEEFPVIALCASKQTEEKIASNLMEVKARGAPIIAFANEGSTAISSIADDVFWLPQTLDPLAPFVSTVASQLFAYYIAKERGCDIDQPRNLAKSVTVE